MKSSTEINKTNEETKNSKTNNITTDLRKILTGLFKKSPAPKSPEKVIQYRQEPKDNIITTKRVLITAAILTTLSAGGIGVKAYNYNPYNGLRSPWWIDAEPRGKNQNDIRLQFLIKENQKLIRESLKVNKDFFPTAFEAGDFIMTNPHWKQDKKFTQIIISSLGLIYDQIKLTHIESLSDEAINSNLKPWYSIGASIEWYYNWFRQTQSEQDNPNKVDSGVVPIEYTDRKAMRYLTHIAKVLNEYNKDPHFEENNQKIDFILGSLDTIEDNYLRTLRTRLIIHLKNIPQLVENGHRKLIINQLGIDKNDGEKLAGIQETAYAIGYFNSLLTPQQHDKYYIDLSPVKYSEERKKVATIGRKLISEGVITLSDQESIKKAEKTGAIQHNYRILPDGI